MNAKTPKANESDGPSSQSASSTTHSSRLRRTLLTASVFALLAMLFVPTPHYGYRLIFSGSDTSIAFFQLLVNVGFAALLGAVLATIIPKIVRGARELPRWAWQGIAGIVVIALISIGAVAWWNLTEAAANRARFAEHAMNLREQALLKVEPPVLVPTNSRPTTQRFPWKMNVVTTVFWIGGPRETDGSVRTASAWDPNWVQNYGGLDDPDSSARRNYIPVVFIPHQNPFYCALPYNDVTHGQFKPEAPSVIPWFKQAYVGPGQSVCKDRWVAIRKGNRTCYAQWEDCGPFLTDHFQYVFQNERPKPNANHGAGVNVSPAVRDCLGLASTDVTDWQFVDVSDVPPGPWRSYGENNHFVIARRQIGQKLQHSGDNPKK